MVVPGPEKREAQTWRLTFTVEVYAASEDEATDLARMIYEDYAGPIRELHEDVRWLLPVADVKERAEPVVGASR